MIQEFPAELAPFFDEDNTFTQSESDKVVEGFVCPVCYGELQIIYIPNVARVAIVCIEHGNVCKIGRITRATVSIQLEAAYRNFHKVIRNLPDLWGNLIEQGFERVQAAKITNYYVCEVCGSFLLMQGRADSIKMDIVDIVCGRGCGNINDTGYVRKEQFVYNFQRIREWNKKKEK